MAGYGCRRGGGKGFCGELFSTKQSQNVLPEPDMLRERAIKDDEPALEQKWAIFNSVLDRVYEMPFNGRMEDDVWPKYKDRCRTLMPIWQRTESKDEDKQPPQPVVVGLHMSYLGL